MRYYISTFREITHISGGRIWGWRCFKYKTFGTKANQGYENISLEKIMKGHWCYGKRNGEKDIRVKHFRRWNGYQDIRNEGEWGLCNEFCVSGLGNW